MLQIEILPNLAVPLSRSVTSGTDFAVSVLLTYPSAKEKHFIVVHYLVEKGKSVNFVH